MDECINQDARNVDEAITEETLPPGAIATSRIFITVLKTLTRHLAPVNRLQVLLDMLDTVDNA